MENYKYLMVSSAKVGREKKHNMANRVRRDMAGVGEAEGNFKV